MIAKAASARGWYLAPAVANPSREQEAELKAFFERPNSEDALADLIFGSIAVFGIFANTFIELVRDETTKKPIELWPLDPINTRIVTGDQKVVLGYVSREDQNNPVMFKPWEVLHIKFGTRKIVTSRGRPGRSLYALSPLDSLLLAAEVDLWAQIHNRNFFMNGAKVRGLWKMGKATIDQVKRNREYLKGFSKPENSHRDLVLEGADVDYSPIGTTIRDMEFQNMRRFTRDEILAVYGVPPSMVSIIETGNIGSGSGESQQQNFREETVIPQQQRIADAFTVKIIREGFGFKDWDFVLETPEIISESSQAEIDVAYISAGVLKPEEVRSMRYAGEPAVMEKGLLKARGHARGRMKPATLAVPQGRTEKTVEIANDLATKLKALLRSQVAKLASGFGEAAHAQAKKTVEANLKGRTPETRYVRERRGLIVWKRYSLPGFVKQLTDLELALKEAFDQDAIRDLLASSYRATAAAAAASAAAKVGKAVADAEAFAATAQNVASELAEHLVRQITDSARQIVIDGEAEGLGVGQIQERLSGLDSFKVEVSRPGSNPYSKERTFAEAADAIARTDTQRFFSTVTASYFRDAGVEKVRWVSAAAPCEECDPFKDQVYALADVPEGGPPAHHNCRCALEPIGGSGE